MSAIGPSAAPRRRPPRRSGPLLAGIGAALVLVLIVIVALLLSSGGKSVPHHVRYELGGVDGRGHPSFNVDAFEPFAYRASRDKDLLDRAVQGLAHPVYVRSPGGVEATAARIERFRKTIEAAAKRHGVDPDVLSGLLFLESAGEVDVIAGKDPSAAVGLAQILPGTATTLLGMHVDLRQSKALTRRIRRDLKRASAATSPEAHGRALSDAIRLQVQRRRVDERFDPDKAIDAAARYLAIAQRRFGRADLAAVSYHMGIGNLEQVIRTYVSPRPLRGSDEATVAANGITYPRLYFDSTPQRNPGTYRKLAALGDDSRHYYFKLLAADEVLRLYRNDRKKLEHISQLQNAKASQEEVLRPESDNPPYEKPRDLEKAYARGDLVHLPNDPRRLDFRIDPGMGELAPKLGQRPALYRGLKPEALAVLLYVAKEAHRIDPRTAMNVTSTVRDQRYQNLLTTENIQATSNFSEHTAGNAFDIAYAGGGRGRRSALSSVLERLRALDVADFVYEPTAIHVTVGPDGARFIPLLQLVPKPSR